MEFKNPLKGIFKSAKDKLLNQPQTRTFVRFFTDNGAKFAEVQDRDVAKLTLPPDTHHFKFFDRAMKKGEEPNTLTLFNGAENISPTHYVVDRVISMTAYNAMPEEEKEKITTPVNPEAVMPGTLVALSGTEARPLAPNETTIIAIDKQTLKQLWPAVEDGPKSSLRDRLKL